MSVLLTCGCLFLTCHLKFYRLCAYFVALKRNAHTNIFYGRIVIVTSDPCGLKVAAVLHLRPHPMCDVRAAGVSEKVKE